MKSTFAILTFLVAAMTIAPRQSYGQYAWVPVYKDAAATEAYNSAPGQTGYATFVDEDGDADTGGDTELKEFGANKGKGDDSKGGCKADCGCPTCRSGGTFSRSFVGVEYLHWWNKGRYVPPLASTGTLPGGTVLFGGDSIGGSLQAGARITGGIWLDDCQTGSLVLRAFGNEGGSDSYAVSTPSTPVFGVPFTDPAGPTPAFLTVSNGAGDTLSVTATNEVVGGDLYYTTNLSSASDYRFDLLGGVQYSRIDDDIDFRVNSPNAPVLGSFRDTYDAANDFFGGELGVLGEVYQGPFTLKVMGKVGLGNMRQKVAISGSRTTPGSTTNGILAHNNFNSGVYERDEFAWSPEVSIKGVWHLKNNISLTVGYSFLYWNNVVLAGDQINTSVPPALIAGTAAAGPASFTFNDTDFWVQTIDVGFAWRY